MKSFLIIRLALLITFCMAMRPSFSQAWFHYNYDHAENYSIAETKSNNHLLLCREDSDSVYLKRLDQNGLIIGSQFLHGVRGHTIYGRLYNAGNKAYYALNRIYHTSTPGSTDFMCIFDSIGVLDTVINLPFGIWSPTATGLPNGELAILQGDTTVPTDYIISRYAQNGERLWSQNVGFWVPTSTSSTTPFRHSTQIVALTNGNILLFQHATNNPYEGEVYLTMLSPSGQLLVQNQDSLDIHKVPRDSGMVICSHLYDNGNVLLAFNSLLIDRTIRLVEYDSQLKFKSSAVIQSRFSEAISVINQTSNGNLLCMGESSIMLLDSSYALIWEEKLPPTIENNIWTKRGFLRSAIPTQTSNGFLISGWSRSVNLDTSYSFVARLDTTRLRSRSTVLGKTYNEDNSNCSLDSNETIIPWSNVEVYESGTLVEQQLSDIDGNYYVDLETGGDYELIFNGPSPYHKSCKGSLSFLPDSTAQVYREDVGFEPDIFCPYLRVNIHACGLYHCEPNTYYVSYANTGTAVAEDAYIEIELDTFMDLRWSSISYTQINDRKYSFDLGDLSVGYEGGFSISAEVDCDSTVLGQTHCVQANIFPDSLCIPVSPNWDGSSISVSGECDGDSIRFTISNTGSDMIDSKNYIIVEDDIILMMKQFRLDSGEVLNEAVPAIGKTVRIIADQSDNHPGNSNPTIAIELCNNSNGSLGFVTQFAEDDENPGVDIHCSRSKRRCILNGLTASPDGFLDANYIDQNRRIEFSILFQNTGHDTAHFVLLRDSVQEHLDLSTLVMTGSSHKFNARIREGGVLEFTLNNITLPDSATNPDASRGFVSFSMLPKKGIRAGTKITKDVDIFFDFNPPVRTNEVFRTIGLIPILTSVNKVHEDLTELTIFPNPIGQNEELHIQGADKILNAHFQIISMEGKVLVNDHLKNGKTKLDSHIFTHGMYLIRVFDSNGGLIASEHFIIH